MTALLQQVIAKVEALPEDQQDAFASEWLDELESERKWDDLFAGSTDELAKMAQEAIDEFHAGQTEPMESLREVTN